MTDPMGLHWHQPAREEILIDDTHAAMRRGTLNRLADYSCTNPTGVYPGKMWRCRRDYYDEGKGWILKWFGIDPNEPDKFCSNNSRIILIVE